MVHAIPNNLAVETVSFETVTVDTGGVVLERATRSATLHHATLVTGVSLDLIFIPSGSFMMGARPGEGFPDERPQHHVRIPSFWMARYPVTQAQWRAVMKELPPCRSRGDDLPVDRVSWHDANALCASLAATTGHAYRLPSEAEWEYACRAGTQSPFAFGDTLTTDLANYVGEHVYRSEPKGSYRHVATAAGTFPHNAFGLGDMHGNVWEWCADAYHDTYIGAPCDGTPWGSANTSRHVLRGGCWHDPPWLCRSAARLAQLPSEAEDYFGFRVAVTSLEVAARPGLSAGEPSRSWLGRLRQLTGIGTRSPRRR